MKSITRSRDWYKVSYSGKTQMAEEYVCERKADSRGLADLVNVES
jgi:hypothetical protein